ncbi:hypothetical protein ABPG75_002983 [Micractinium tetrahymenae]
MPLLLCPNAGTLGQQPIMSGGTEFGITISYLLSRLRGGSAARQAHVLAQLSDRLGRSQESREELLAEEDGFLLLVSLLRSSSAAVQAGVIEVLASVGRAVPAAIVAGGAVPALLQVLQQAGGEGGAEAGARAGQGSSVRPSTLDFLTELLQNLAVQSTEVAEAQPAQPPSWSACSAAAQRRGCSVAQLQGC